MSLMDHEREFAIREVLTDLGWFPSELNCEEKRRLADEYLSATVAWFEVASGLWLTILRRAYRGSLSGECDPSVPAIDEARRKAARVRLALDTHIAAHDC